MKLNDVLISKLDLCDLLECGKRDILDLRYVEMTDDINDLRDKIYIFKSHYDLVNEYLNEFVIDFDKPEWVKIDYDETYYHLKSAEQSILDLSDYDDYDQIDLRDFILY